MNKYGHAAVEAVKLIHNRPFINPKEAWNIATSKIFGKGTSSQKKGCPRNAFLGLCEHGLVKGVQPGEYTNSKKNKQYAINAVKVLREQPHLVNNSSLLWEIVIRGIPKSPNNQIDIVTALWINNLIG